MRKCVPSSLGRPPENRTPSPAGSAFFVKVHAKGGHEKVAQPRARGNRSRRRAGLSERAGRVCRSRPVSENQTSLRPFSASRSGRQGQSCGTGRRCSANQGGVRAVGARAFPDGAPRFASGATACIERFIAISAGTECGARCTPKRREVRPGGMDVCLVFARSGGGKAASARRRRLVRPTEAGQGRRCADSKAMAGHGARD